MNAHILIKLMTVAAFLYICKPNDARAACDDDPLCVALQAAIVAGAQADTAAGVQPLGSGELLSHIANRFGFGVGSLDPAWLPDTFTTTQLPSLLAILAHQGQNPSSVAHLNALKKELHRKIFSEREQATRKRGGIFANFSFRPSVRNAFKNSSGDIDLTNHSLSQIASERIALAHEMKNGQTEEIRVLASTELGLTRRVVQKALSLEPLLFQSLGSIRHHPGQIRDIQVNFSRVLSEFWFNHFNIDVQKSAIYSVGPLHYENLILGSQYSNFRALLEAVIKSPAMLVYLDNRINKWEGASAGNQNLGRELLELHTFGTGPRGSVTDTHSPYNQIDVEVAATILTGHNVRSDASFGYQFYSERHFPGSFQHFFWHNRTAENRPLFFNLARLAQLDAFSGPQRLSVTLSWLSEHPSTKRNICRKISARFVQSGTLLQTLNERCQAAYGDRGNLKAIYRSILTTPELWQRGNFNRKLKNPHELVISRFRSLGLSDQSFNNEQGLTDGKKLLASFEDLHVEIENHGLEYRTYGDPTGYEIEGRHWMNSGFLIAFIRHGFSLAHMDRAFNLSVKIRDFTTQQSTLEQIANIGLLPDGGLSRNVAAIVYGNSDRSAMTSRFLMSQGETVRTLVQTGDSAADQVDLNSTGAHTRSIPDSLLALSFHAGTKLFK